MVKGAADGPPAASTSRSGPTPTLLKPPPLKQTAISFGGAAGSSSTSGSSSGSTGGSGRLRQARIGDLRAVVDYRAADQQSLDVPSTLYLGADDVAKLRDKLEESADDVTTLLRVLRRLSAMCAAATRATRARAQPPTAAQSVNRRFMKGSQRSAKQRAIARSALTSGLYRAPPRSQAVHAQPARDDQHRPDRRKAEETRRRGGADARAPARRHVEAAARRAPAAGQDCGEQQHGPAVILDAGVFSRGKDSACRSPTLPRFQT